MRYLVAILLGLGMVSSAEAQSMGYGKGYRYDRPYRGEKGPRYDSPYRGGKGLREDRIQRRGNEWRWQPRR